MSEPLTNMPDGWTIPDIEELTARINVEIAAEYEQFEFPNPPEFAPGHVRIMLQVLERWIAEGEESDDDE